MVLCGSSPSTRSEIVDERSIHVVRQQHQIGTLGLDQLRQLGERFLAQRHAAGIAGIDDEERLDLRVLELLDLVVGRTGSGSPAATLMWTTLRS